jgi:CDK inhibitor PHO81
VRLRALIDQRKLLQARVAGTTTLNGAVPSLSRDSSNYGALYEGFRNFERDLGRLQVRGNELGRSGRVT